MDTILFFCKKKGLREPEAEPVGMRAYLLIRVMLDVGEEEWFGVRLGEDGAARKGRAEEQDTAACRIVHGSTSAQGDVAAHRSAAVRSDTSVYGGAPVRGSVSVQDGAGMREKPTGYGAVRGSAAAQDGAGMREEPTGYGAVRGSVSVQDGAGMREEPGGCGADGSGGGCGIRKLLRRVFFGGGQSGKGAASPHRLTREEKKRILAQEQERERQRAERQERLDRVEESLRRLSSKLAEWAGEPENCQCVYEDSVRKALLGGEEAQGRRILPALWGRYFPMEEFDGGCRQFWVEQLLPAAVLPHYVILGSAPCLPVVIENCARRMKSLRWVLCETDYSQELQDFVEDFYTEYGLAIMLRTFPAGQRLSFACPEPANILDFTKDARIPPPEAEGSIWLDMRSVEEKKRRLGRGGAFCRYESLKEMWKRARRREPFIP